MENKTDLRQAGISESKQGYFEEELYCSGNSLLQSTLCDKKLEEIKSGYGDSEVCMGEMLASVPADGASVPADGLTVEEAFYLYIRAMQWAEGDRFFRWIYDGKEERF